MITKLIKYEMKKGLLPYIILISLSIFLSTLVLIQVTSITKSIYNTDMIALSLMFISILFGFIITISFGWISFQGVMYLADEYFRSKGYLTFSTPNSSYKIIASKLITYAIRLFIFIFILLVFILIGITILSNDIPSNSMIVIFSNLWFIIPATLIFIISFVNWMLFIYFIMTLNVTIFDFEYKILASILMWFGSYIIWKVITFIFQISIFQYSGWFENFYMTISNNIPIKMVSYTGEIYNSTFPFPLVFLLILSIGIFALLYTLTCKLINRGINI